MKQASVEITPRTTDPWKTGMWAAWATCMWIFFKAKYFTTTWSPSLPPLLVEFTNVELSPDREKWHIWRKSLYGGLTINYTWIFGFVKGRHPQPPCCSRINCKFSLDTDLTGINNKIPIRKCTNIWK